MPRNDQPKSSTLRSRQRITNKTRLRVIHGSIDAETVTIGEDDGRGVLHSTQGVEAEDAAEHHLQQVLNAANNSANNHQRNQRPSTADAATQATPAAPPPPPEATFIPTPDAAGVVENYDELYLPKSFEMSYAILKFSDTLEESHKYGLAGRSYTMDERDAAWLERWNQQARGEGTSAGPTRRSRSKASTEAEETPSIAIDEDWFELVMGMFEKFSSEHFPFLHVDHAYPQFSYFEPLFSRPYTTTLFACSLIPEGLPSPSDLAQMAQGIYPHWIERKMERGGRPIMPDINLDESDEGNVYVCFRRREIKPIRKTRRMETTSIDKLTRLSIEFQSALELANKSIEREETKKSMCDADQSIWTLRSRMIAITNKFPDLRNEEDDKWLVDKEKVKKTKTIDPLPPLRIPRPPPTATVFDEPLDLGPPQVHPRVRYNDIQYKIEQDIQKKREQDVLGWIDVTNAPIQPSMPTSQRYFRSVPSRESSSTKKDSQPSLFRHRIGRGGRRYLDRRVSPFTSTPLPPRSTKPAFADSFNSIFSSVYPSFSLPIPSWSALPHASFLSTDAPESNDDTDEVDTELARKLEERWKFDSDTAPSNLESDIRPILDDFDYRQSNYRNTLIKDREWLLMPDQSKAVSDSKINLTAHLLDALKVQKEHQMHQLQQAVTNGITVPAAQPNPNPNPNAAALQLQRAAAAAIVATGGAIRPPSIPQGLSPQGVARSPQVALAHQQALREKQQQAAAATPPSQSSPSQSQPTTQTTPQSTNNGTPAPVPVAVPVPLPVGTVNGTASPPKSTVNGTYNPSPVPSPLPPSAIVTPDIGSTVRVSTPLRKPAMPLQPGGNLQLNGFGHNIVSNGNPVAAPYPGFQNGMQLTAGMYNNLQNMKLISQHNQQQQQQLMSQYQQQYPQQQMTAQQIQQQHFQNQQQLHQQQLQQLQLMQLQQAGGLMNQPIQTHFNEALAQNQHALMAAQQNAQAMQTMQSMHGQNMFPMGINPSMNNSALNMTVQNMNLTLGPQNMALRLPPNRAQQQQQQQNTIHRPTPMGVDYGMNVMHGAGPMIQGLGLGMNGNAQMAAAMSISRAPSTPLSMRTGGGLMPNGNMLMSRAQSVAPMQSPMMRPTSAASMHSNMGMPMQQPGPSLPVSLQGSPANMTQHPPTPHLRQQTVPGS